MALSDQISQLVTPAVESQGLFLEDVHIVSPGKHRIVTCIVDGPTSLNLDQVTAVSRAISELLDEATFMGETPFTLEVTSPGVDRPLPHLDIFPRTKAGCSRSSRLMARWLQGEEWNQMRPPLL